MDPEHRKILANNRVYLKNNLYVSAEMLSYLRDDKIITEEHEETLMKGRLTRVSRCLYFVDLIMKRGERAFECFLRSLILSNQLFVAKHLHNELTERILIDLKTSTENKCRAADLEFNDPEVIDSLKNRFKDLDIKDPEVVGSLKHLLKDYPEECGMPILKTVLTRIDFNNPNMLECFKPLLNVLALSKGCIEGTSTSSLLKRTNFQFNPKVLAYLVPLVEAAVKEAPPRVDDVSVKDEEYKESLNEFKFHQGQVVPVEPSAPAHFLLPNEFSFEDVHLTPTAPSLSASSILLDEPPQNANQSIQIIMPPNEVSKPELLSPQSREDEDEPDRRGGSFKNSGKQGNKSSSGKNLVLS